MKVPIVLNKTISGGQSKRRPDALINCGSHVLLVEIDENSHRSYVS